ncbi:MAG: hypothetical protein DRJ05_01785 [Bacteroidetes bacterium]|nr:MAG: hypothetical protein DRJ05_01785 [Bacteroidota bacterium]
METKDQTNQNPEEKIIKSQGENSQSVENADIKKETDTALPVEEQGAEDVGELDEGTETPSQELKNEKDTVEVNAAVPDTPEEKTELQPEAVEETAPEEKEEEIVAEEAEVEPEADEGEKPVDKEEDKGMPETSSDKSVEAEKEVKKVVVDKEPQKNVDLVGGSEPENIEGEDDQEEVDEEDSDEVPIESKPEIKYDELSRDKLVEMLESTVNEGEVQQIKSQVAQIKVAYLKIKKKVEEQEIANKVEPVEGEVEKEPETDPLELRFNEAFNIYRKKRKQYLNEQERIKQANLEAKKVILEELKALIDSEESLRKTYDEFKVLQERWKEVGMVPKEELNNLWQSYHFFVEKFFDKVKINRELRDLDMKKNMEAKLTLCEKAEELLIENSILKSFKDLQKLHDKWREVGPVPQDKRDELWDRFKSTTDKINQRRHEHYLKFQEEQKSNLMAKTALCEKAEELVAKENTSIKHWQLNTAEITDLLKVWKTLGPAPRKQNDEIWERFKSSLDSFFSVKKEYFQKIKDEQQNNYNLKLDLCTQAEAIKSDTDWRKTTADLIKLQKEWKEIGPVPRKHSDKIWKRFRAACDEFFNNKSEFFANIGKHEIDNQKLKEELIEKVKSFAFEGNDKNKNLEVLKGFQREWTNIGHVPIKEKNRLQNELREAVNIRLDELKISQAEMQSASYRQRMENIKDKPDSRRILYNERNFLSNKRNKLIEEIGLWENNLGFFAESKKANLLKEEFEKKINKAKGELELLKAKIKFLDKQGD